MIRKSKKIEIGGEQLTIYERNVGDIIAVINETKNVNQSDYIDNSIITVLAISLSLKYNYAKQLKALEVYDNIRWYNFIKKRERDELVKKLKCFIDMREQYDPSKLLDTYTPRQMGEIIKEINILEGNDTSKDDKNISVKKKEE